MFWARGLLLVCTVCVPGAWAQSTSKNGMTYENSERRMWIPISSCREQDTYAGYECAKAYDGIIEEGKNGWSIKGGTPKWVEFTLREPSKVNRVALKSLWAGNLFRPSKFQIELNINGQWKNPEKMRLENQNFKADISGNKISMKENKDDISVAFKVEENVTKVKITIPKMTVTLPVVLTEVLVQYVPEVKNCTTVGGTQRGRQCIFPFVNPWTKAVHYGCATDYGLPPWCATRVNSDWTMTDYQYSGFCNESCEIEEPSTCYTLYSWTNKPIYGTKKIKERRSCVFPFNYEGKWYTECILGKGKLKGKNLKVCATVTDRNGKLLDLGYCGPECPGSDVAAQCVSAVGQRSSINNRCVFPYYYNKKYYNSCEDGKFSSGTNDQRQCATGISYDSMEPLSGQWGFCGTEPCDKNACITVGGAHVGQQCKFPFRNKWTRELHFGCTTASLAEEVGSSSAYASAPWCATDTDSADEMKEGKWGFCSKKCGVEDGTNCYVDEGKWQSETKKCIFPFIYNGLERKQCVYVKGYLSCPVKVDENAIAKEGDMRRCGPSPSCFNKTTINGNPITIGYKDVGSYTNSGSKELEIAFTFETGVEDSSESNWNVEASVSAGFDAFGASIEASVTAGGGGGASSSTSSQQSHSLTYKCPPNTRVVLSQQVFASGVFESRTFKLILTETKIGSSRKEETTRKELNREDLNIISKNLIKNKFSKE